MLQIEKFRGLTGNQLKILALITMTCDHVGKMLMPECAWLQIVGRLALPIFAYMIAEGCRYTKNKTRYLLTMFGVGILCQIVYYVTEESLYQCILITFSLSILMIYALDFAQKKKSVISWIVVATCFAAIYFITTVLPSILADTNFKIDYDLYGVMLPVLIYMGRTKLEKLFFMSFDLVMLSLSYGGFQWYGLFAIIPLMLYGGERGKLKLKYLFYIYYPLHLGIIYLMM